MKINSKKVETLSDLSNIDLYELNGATKAIVEKLAKQQITNVLQLLEHYPRRYIDKTNLVEIEEVLSQNLEESDLPVTIYATVIKVYSRRTRQGKSMVTITASDNSGEIEVVFFNQAWRSKQLKEGVTAGFNGKVKPYKGKMKFTNPIVDVFSDVEDVRKILPVYPQFGKDNLMSWNLFPLIKTALDQFVAEGAIEDYLAPKFRKKWNLVKLSTAYKHIHLPESFSEVTQAERRLRFNEFFRMQLALMLQRQEVENSITTPPVKHSVEGDLVDIFYENLPFTLTEDQIKVIAEIKSDMGQNKVMHRLLQGEVGSGKTLVAWAAIIFCVQGGNQALFMAPTEVLAEQHFLVAKDFFKNMKVKSSANLMGERPFKTVLLSNNTSAAQRTEYRRAMELGDVDLVIGTHALLFDKSNYPSLGLIVIDEQHKFGVEQRASFNNANPDMLVMTATPIPRTAAMLFYGDLQLSEIKTLPKGRKPIVTKIIEQEDRPEMFNHVRAELEQGRQIYVVCPLIEESKKLEVESATRLYKQLKEEDLSDYRIGLLHGQMPSEAKEDIMHKFRNHELDVLVATTVIEVGVDVPNSSIMIIESANRFGISQLHQLRGRIGRGEYESFCYLCSDLDDISDNAKIRLKALEKETSGFKLSEVDLDLRGAGQVFGSKQSGFGDLKLGKIPRDVKYIEPAREAAQYYFDRIKSDESQQIIQEIKDRLDQEDVSFLVKS